MSAAIRKCWELHAPSAYWASVIDSGAGERGSGALAEQLPLLTRLASGSGDEALLAVLSDSVPELRSFAHTPLHQQSYAAAALREQANVQPAASTPPLLWSAVGGHMAALQAWSGSGTAAPQLQEYGAGQPAQRTELLHLILLLSVAQAPSFLSAARAELRRELADGQEALLASLRWPGRRTLLPSLSALGDAEQAAVRAGAEAHAALAAVLCGEAPAEALVGHAPAALEAAAAAHGCLRAAAACGPRGARPLLAVCDALCALLAARAGPWPAALRLPEAADAQRALLLRAAGAAMPLFELEVLATVAPSERQERLLFAFLRILALCSWAHPQPKSVLRALRQRAADAPGEDVMLRELGGPAQLPALHLRCLGAAMRRAAAATEAADMVAGVAALLLAARRQLAACDGDEGGVLVLDCSQLAEAARLRPGQADPGRSFRQLCEMALVRRLSGREAVLVIDP